MSKYCYATLLTEPRYLPCVIRCKQTMEHYNTKYPYLALIPEGDKYLRNILEGYGILCEEIHVDKFNPLESSQMWLHSDTINKMQLLNLVQYDKILYLDADIVLCGNIDDEFDKIAMDEEFGFYTDNGVITGLMFMVKPIKNFYASKILPLKDKYENDELIYWEFYSHQTGLREVPENVIHFGGPVKPWQNGEPALRTIRWIFLRSSKEEFISWIENRVKFDGILNAWFFHQKSVRVYAYVALILSKEDMIKVVELNRKMKKWGFSRPLIACIPEEAEFLEEFLFNSDNMLFRIIPKDNYENTMKKISCLVDIFKMDYHAIGFINNLDMEISENFDYIFAKSLDPEIKKKATEKYSNNLLILELFD